MSSRAWAAFATVSVLWGMPYLFIKIALDDGVPPAFLAWSRVVLGAALLLALAWHARVLAPLRGRWRVLLAFAVVEIALPFPLIALGEQHVSSSLAAIMIATVPLLVAVLTARFDRAQRPTGRRLVGLLVGFAGVVALVGIDVAGDGDALLGVGALALAAAGYATGPMILSRHLTAVDPRAVTGAALGLATVLLAPAALLNPPTRMPAADAVVAIVLLGVLCTAAAFSIMAFLIGEAGPSRAVVITYINPVVAVVLGMAVLGEQPGPGAVAGLVLILTGSWLATRGTAPPAALAAATER